MENDLNFDDLVDFEEIDPIVPLDPPIEEDKREEDTPPPVVEPPIEDEHIDEDNEPDPENVKGYFDFMKSVGLIDVPDDFEFDGKTETLEKALETSKHVTKVKAVEELWDALPDDFKPLLEFGLAGGKSLKQYMDAYAPIDYDNIDLSNEETQKAVIRQYRKATFNHDDERIEKFIEKIDSKGGLEEEAEDALQELINLREEQKANLIRQAEAAEAQRKQAAQEQVALLSSIVDKVDYIEDARKARVKTFALTPVKIGNKVTTGLDRTLESIFNNPEHFVQFADLLADYQESKGFDYDRLKKKASTTANKSIKDLINSIPSSRPTGGSASKKTLRDDFNWEEDIY